MDIKRCVEDISEVLCITTPEVSFDISNFTTPTMLAQVDVVNNKIYIKNQAKSDLDLVFTICHELRHLWQIKNDKEKYANNYHTAETMNVEEYNLQPAEVDANAFASLFMQEMFGVKPLWNGLNNKVKTAIEKRATEIREEMKLS